MKARVKKTGEIISLDEKSTVLDANPCNFNSYEISELEILYENTNFPKDYWRKLEHTYAGMAMQGILSNANHALWDRENNAEGIAKSASAIAHALVEKMKEKEERK
jgi:hypothetical protein